MHNTIGILFLSIVILLGVSACGVRGSLEKPPTRDSEMVQQAGDPDQAREGNSEEKKDSLKYTEHRSFILDNLLR